MLNGILTVLTLAFAVFVVNGFVRWVLAAYWEPVWANRKLFAVGPIRPTNWQPAVVLLVTCLLFGRRRALGQYLAQSGNRACRAARRAGDHSTGAQAQMVMALALAAVVVGYLLGLTVQFPNRWLVWAWILSLPFTFIMLRVG